MTESRSSLGELAAFFLRLGLTAFGGPAAHLAMMHAELVVRRRWLTETEFLDLIAAANFIPGPNSTEVAIHIGYRRAGTRGLLVAGSCFILPAALLCVLIAALYVRYGRLPVSAGILYGVKPVVIAIVAQALYRLARSVIKSPLIAGIVVVAAIVNYFLHHELLVLFGAGVLVLIARHRKIGSSLLAGAVPTTSATGPATASAPATMAAATTAGAAAVTAGLWPLFLVFLKIGSVLFGSGYVLLAFLQADLVDRNHWLTQPQLLDAIAVGQFTPGPVFTTATFIGYVISGPMGALVATIGIFLPAFFFVAITAPLLPRLRKSKPAAAFLDGLNAGSLALMAVVTVQLSAAALIDPLTMGLALASLLVLFWKKNLNSAWLVLAGGLVGIAAAFH